MKINFIVPEISRTGGMRIIFEYANRLTERGNDVMMFSPYIPFNYYKGIIKRHYIKYRIRYAIGFLRGTRKPPEDIFPRKFEIQYSAFINNRTVRNADAVIATSWPTAFAVDKLSAAKGKKFYLVQDYEKWNSNIKYVDKSYSLPLTRITVSTYLKELLLKKFNSDSTVILNGVDFEVFNNPEKKFEKPYRVCFMDHSLDNKNAKAAIDTVKMVKENFPNTEFTAFGYRKSHEMPPYVEFIENPDDAGIAEIYRSSDIYLYTSLYEGFGLPPAEAMACKCALVGNKAGAVPEFATDKESAILTDPGKPDELYEGVKYLLENPGEMERISFAGYERVKEILNWDRSVDEFERVLEGKEQA